jgi:glycosyltransferase involved in cell wall biosynthesis
MAGGKSGGAENFFIRLVCALSEAGINQEAIIRKHSERFEQLAGSDIPVTQLPFGGRLDCFTGYNIKKKANEYHPDIIMSWMNRASRITPKGQWQNVGRLGGYYNLKYYKNCDYLICNTKDICDYVIKQGRRHDNVIYIPNFVDEEQFPPVSRSVFGTPNEAPLLLALGRFHENKAFDTLLIAISYIKDVYLWMAGEGPLENKLKKQTIELGISNRVRFLGWHKNIAELLSTADIFICPSRHEPFGNVILEAWAHSKPVVATLSEGPRQLIHDGVNGLLVPVDDPEAMAMIIQTLINDKATAQLLAGNGYEAYKKCFSKETVVREYKKFFEGILN